VQDDQYKDLIETYRRTVLHAFERHRDGLLHANPHKVLQTALELEQHIRNTGGLIDCLKREGYANQAFYAHIDQMANRLINTAMAVPCWGLPREFIGHLERELVSLCEEDGLHDHHSTHHKRTRT